MASPSSVSFGVDGERRLEKYAVNSVFVEFPRESDLEARGDERSVSFAIAADFKVTFSHSWTGLDSRMIWAIARSRPNLGGASMHSTRSVEQPLLLLNPPSTHLIPLLISAENCMFSKESPSTMRVVEQDNEAYKQKIWAGACTYETISVLTANLT